jgi:3-hydroxyisobutyrate dehydrogenase-like beta-hydroxyacid dehydrogenase
MGNHAGLVGLGLMGQAMSSNLLKAGQEVFGCDILPAQMHLAQEKGIVLSWPVGTKKSLKNVCLF